MKLIPKCFNKSKLLFLSVQHSTSFTFDPLVTFHFLIILTGYLNIPVSQAAVV